MRTLVAIGGLLVAGCSDKKPSSGGSAGSGSGSATGSATQTLAQALAIVCGSVARAQQDPRWAQLDAGSAAARAEKREAAGYHLGLIHKIVDREVTNPEVIDLLRSDDGESPSKKAWADLLTRGGVTSCPYLEWRVEQAQKRLAEDAIDSGAGSATVAMGSSKHVPDGRFFRCNHKDRTFELWDGGGFEFRYNQVGIEGTYELRGHTIVFIPSDAGKAWKDYTGLDATELEASKDWTKAGPFTCTLN